MPKWLVKSTVKELDRIDKEHEKGNITDKEHVEQSKKVIEKALSIEKNITLKYRKHKSELGKLY